LKEALDTFAEDRGTTLTTAVVDLIERGLDSVTNARSIADLEQKAVKCAAELRHTRARLGEAEARLQTAMEREQMNSHAYKVLAERAQQELGRCPACTDPVRGYDVLVTGSCPNCSQTLTPLVTPANKTEGLNQTDYLVLLGAVGLLVGAALAGNAG